MLRVVFHAINGLGLAHLVRSICLAEEVRKLDPASQILVLTTALDVTLLVDAGLDFVQFPPRLSDPHADPLRHRITVPEETHLMAATEVLSAFRPHLVVFDTHAPAALTAAATGLGARTVLVLRELSPDRFAEWLNSNAWRTFDSVVIPHEPEDLEDISLPCDRPIHLAGPVTRLSTSSLTAHEETWFAGSGPVIVATAGGGGQPVDATRYLSAMADAHWLLRAQHPDLTTIMVTGPYGRSPRSFPGLHVIPFTPRLPELLRRATVIVSQAGYNAIAEIRCARRPAVLVPGIRRMEDQSRRARRMADHGAALLCKANSRQIANKLQQILSDPGRRDAMIAAHDNWPLVPANRAVAESILRPIRLPRTSPRRIVLVAPEFPPRIGGMETVAAQTARELARRGYDITVYTTSRLGTPDIPGVKVRPLYTSLPPPATIDLDRDLHLTLAALAIDRPDVLHLMNSGLSPWIPSIRTTNPVAVGVTVHGNDVIAPWIHHNTDAESYRHALRHGLAAADIVIAVSGFSATLARNAGALDPKVVPNGVDPVVFTPDGTGPPAPLPSPTGATILLTVSRLVSRKGHRTVILALPAVIAANPKVHYLYTGSTEAVIDELTELARSLGVAAHVHALGTVRAADLPALYQSATAFILVPDGPAPEDVEGLGVSLLEAASSGLPVIASSSGGVPDAVVQGETGILVPPGDPGATATAILEVLANPAAFGAAGRRRIQQSFTWSHVVDRLLDHWQTAHESRQGAAPAAPDEGGAELARQSRSTWAQFLEESAHRRDRARRANLANRPLVLRATGEGARLLPAALADCIAIGHRPDIEVKLTRYLDPDFRRHVSAHARTFRLHHGVPNAREQRLREKLDTISDAEIKQVRAIHLHIDEAARTDHRRAMSLVPEVHRMRMAFTARRIVVVPPPELMRYLSLTPGGPATGMIEPTNHCNLACPTCPTGTGKIAPLPDMTLDQFAGTVTQLRPALRNLALWNYGEPTLNRQLPQMIRSAKDKGVNVVKISSNVHFLDPARGAALLESGLDVLILSVDGASQETYQKFRQQGDFSRVLSALDWLCSEKRKRNLKKPSIELQFIVMRHNEHELPDIRELARKSGVDRLRIKSYSADDAGNRESVPLNVELSRYKADGATPNASQPFCTMPWDHTVVNVDGSVTPCCYLRPDMGDQFIMGNIFQKPFVEIWRGERYRRFREQMLTNRQQMPVCAGCRGGTNDLLLSDEEVTS